MVRQGYAWAFVRYSAGYVKEEAAAKAEGLGIWQGEAMPAWEFRAILLSDSLITLAELGLGFAVTVAVDLGDGQAIGVRRAAGVHGNKTAGLDDAIERAAVGHQIAQHRECLRAPGFDGDGLAIMKMAHVQLTSGGATLAAMSDAVDDQ